MQNALPGSTEWMIKSGEAGPRYYAIGSTRWGSQKSPKDCTGFINAPSKQAQDQLSKAKPPGCCWWAHWAK